MRLNLSKSRCATVAAVLTGALAAMPATSRAEIIEIGGDLSADDAPAASCPEPCFAITRTTGFQKRIDGDTDLFTVPHGGRIVAWTIALGEPSVKQAAFFDSKYGEGASANITVFRVGKKKPDKGIGTNIGQSGVQQLEPYMGQIVQFPMVNTVRVHKGDRVALTVPTWAPALAVEQSTTTRWRATRDPEACTDLSAQRAIREEGTETAFGCAYKTERMLYSATLVTGPTPNKTDKPDKKKN